MTLCFSGSVASMQHDLLGTVLKASGGFAQLHPPLSSPRNSAHLLKKMMCQLGQAEQRGAEFCWAIFLGCSDWGWGWL